MFLSDEQMHAVHHGLSAKEPTWEWVDLPVGPQPIPAWAKGFHVDFMMGYGNSPHYHLKTNTDLRNWPDQRFRKEGARYMSTTDDGRAEVLYHDGQLSLTDIRMFRSTDGTLKQYRAGSCHADLEAGEWVDLEMMATTKQSGFGGSHFHLTMEDGRVFVLRGPWHGSSPKGYMETGYIDMTQERAHHGWWAKRAWHARGGRGGLFITDDLFMRLLARFAPECRCARINDQFGVHLQAVRGDWGEPKAWVVARERAARG